MRAGLPVVASDVGGVREAVADGVTGFTTRPGDVDDFTGKLRTLAMSPDMRARFGLAARASYDANFTRQIMLQRTFGVYREAVPIWKTLPEPALGGAA
jgi:glycosyltransferase involved in cell wall biosynthesis